MPQVYMVIDGIEGESLTMEGAIDVVGFDNEMVYAYDRENSRKTGNLQYLPINVYKRMDQATPLLFKALTDNENISKVELLFYRQPDAGDAAIEHFFTITLTDVRVIGIKPYMTPNSTVNELESLMELVSFVPKTIDWLQVIASKQHMKEIRTQV